ncbi:SGNH/GDSL hydrolase family protein [Humisphaera borealis]|uniref:SGNH/GDSL hydrolase family protein n=1 Tax=Humisphaera borealis TaxID=2807512 RepID=A0A7M2WRH2_9BACT|nr:SGNH/GDSL hydrolase family protein [Humisphaera borealis]QOV88023.1 SGNH/GDSL hydrolase family protein [Humisphaera borealis]
MRHLASLIALALILLVAPLHAAETLGDAKRVLFLGDSITYGGNYVDAVETALRLKYPDRKIEYINCGLPSETVSGLSEAGHAGGKFPRPDLHERLDRVLAKTKPDLIFACYGMNDGIYMPLAPDRLAAFQNGMKKLREKAAAIGARVVHVTPPVFDPMPIAGKVVPKDQATEGKMYAGYDEVLAAYGDWLLSQRSAGWEVIDLHGPMTKAIADGRTKDPKFKFSGDGIHPNADGHLVMAKAILAGLTPPVEIDTKTYGDPGDPKSKFSQVEKLVRERGRILLDAYLTDAGHKRPMKAGLPMPEALAKAAEIEKKIQAAK